MLPINKDFKAVYSKDEVNFIRKFLSINELKDYFDLKSKDYNSVCFGNCDDVVSWLSPEEYKRLSKYLDFQNSYSGKMLYSPSGKGADANEIREFVKNGKVEAGNRDHLDIIALHGFYLAEEYLSRENVDLFSDKR